MLCLVHLIYNCRSVYSSVAMVAIKLLLWNIVWLIWKFYCVHGPLVLLGQRSQLYIRPLASLGSIIPDRAVFNTLRREHNAYHFVNDEFNTFLDTIKCRWFFFQYFLIESKAALVWVMTWHRTNDKLLLILAQRVKAYFTLICDFQSPHFTSYMYQMK